ncbi:hypothetical protein DFJ74DRAFT_708251 [Hyaloraphidium curvatum]|nr:hypothetical protein DFJ74DRAFT_708251 [Hyaloraphidium curvatum]
MGLGKLIVNEGNVRAYPALIAAKYNGLELETASDDWKSAIKSAGFLESFPLGKIPAFEGADGLKLFEGAAIAYYVAAAKEGSQLLGKDKAETAQVLQYVSFADSEIVPAQAAWTYPILGWIPVNKGAVTKATEDVKRVLGVLNTILLKRTYLVGESVTLADIAVFSALLNLYKLVLDPETRAPFGNVNRWFTTIANQPEVVAVVGETALAEKAAAVEAPKKEEKKPKEEKKKEEKPKEEKKKEEKPKKEEDDAMEDEEEAPQEKKKPNAMDLLPPSPFNLDNWKRFYSNNNTRPDAVNYFWDNFDKEGWSMWRLDYKYNDELTLWVFVFMSSNLIGGFFQRLEACRKYAFGTLIVFGEDGKNEIHGYFIIRGQEVPEILKDVPDYESYNFTKVDTTDPAVRKNWEDYIAWDGDLEGMKFADGKIFK